MVGLKGERNRKNTDKQVLTHDVGLFPVDEKLISWYRAKATTAAMFNSPLKERINHERIDDLVKSKLVADPGASYAKELYL